MSPRDIFLLCYTAIVGLLAGIFGNVWATAFFEYVIRHNPNLAAFF
jgi:hypothetical protein